MKIRITVLDLVKMYGSKNDMDIGFLEVIISQDRIVGLLNNGSVGDLELTLPDLVLYDDFNEYGVSEQSKRRDANVAGLNFLNGFSTSLDDYLAKLRETFGLTVVGIWERGKFIIPKSDYKINRTSVLVLAGSEESMRAYEEIYSFYHIYKLTTDPVLIIGGGRVGYAIAERFKERETPYLIIEKNARAVQTVLQALSLRLRNTDDLLAEICFSSLSSRLARRLAEMAAPAKPAESGTQSVRLTQRELASMLGTTRESVNKELKVLRDRGILSTSRNLITIHDPQGLRRSGRPLRPHAGNSHQRRRGRDGGEHRREALHPRPDDGGAGPPFRHRAQRAEGACATNSRSGGGHGRRTEAGASSRGDGVLREGQA